MHVKNPVGDFSPTGFVEQPRFVEQPHKNTPALSNGGKILLKEFNPSLMVDYSSFFFLPGTTNPNPARIALAAAPKIDNS